MVWTKSGDGQDFIAGGMQPDEGELLQSLVRKVARPGMVAFEIGCYTGWTSRRSPTR